MRCIIVICVFLLFMPLSVCGLEVKVGVYDRLCSMPSRELLHQGLEYVNQKNLPDSALQCLTIVANRRFEKTKDTLEIKARANALNFIGQMYSDFYYDYQKAFEYFYLAEQYAREHRFNRILPVIHNNIAHLRLMNMGIHHQDKNAWRVVYDLKTAFNEAVVYHNYDMLGHIAMHIGIIGMSWNHIDSVRNELLAFQSMELGDESQEYLRYFCQAIVEYGDNRHEEALSLLEKSLACVVNDNAKVRATDSVVIYSIEMEMLLKAGREREALGMSNKILEISGRADLRIGIYDLYETLFTYYKEKGNEAQAVKYELLHLREKDNLVSKSKLSDVEQTKFLFEVEKLNEEAREQAERERMKTYMLWGVVMFLLIVMGLLVVLYRKYREVREKNHQLYQKVQEQLAEMEQKKYLLATMTQTESKPKYQKNAMSEEEKTTLLHQVFAVMESSPEVFQNDFTIQRLAELVGGNPNYVSQVINEKYKRNFNTMLNEYRIREACRRMSDISHYGHLTIEGIASSVGIRSRSSFIEAFKRFTGMKPSDYQRMAKENSVSR